jgi:hypothetical protein
LPALGVGFRGWLDFSAFYVAGVFAFTPDVARLEPIVRFQHAHGLPITPYVYPAGIALAYVPLAQLPYPLAGALHLVLMAAVLALTAAIGADLVGLPRRWAVLGTFAWAPAAAGAISGQNTSVALLLVVLAAAALRGTERRAHDTPCGPPEERRSRLRSESVVGVLVGLLAYKPQLSAPLAGLLAVRGRLIAVALVAAVLAVHYVLGIVATGGNAAWPLDWLATVRAYTVEDFRANGWQAVSLPAFLARFDLAMGTGTPFGPLALLGLVLGAALVIASLPALRRWPAVSSVALACAVGLVINPHAWVYDATLLLPALAVFVRAAAARGWPAGDRWLLCGAYAAAASWPIGGIIGFVPLLVVVLAAPIVLLRIVGTGRVAPV